MTLVELNAHLILIQKLNTAREMLQTLETAALTASRLDTMPRAAGLGDRTAALAIKCAEQEEIVARLERTVDASSVAVKEFIDSVTDNRLNVILYLRFVCGYEWQAVAEIIGGRNTENAVKSLVYRFFRSQAL